MGGKGKDESVDPFTGKGYTADEMPEDPTLPAEFSPFLQPPTTQKPELFRAPGAGPLAPPAGSGGTDFEPYRLNQIVDLVEDASPQDLEDVGDALWDAARAIRKAAEELKTYFDGVESEWKGEAKEHFSDWATGLHRDTLKLSEYAGAAGTQLKAAGFGLSMVKASMPKRDPKEDEIFGPYLPPKITKKSTPELREREKNRQEAIQQANKLSSYYTVALTNIKAAEESKPVFATMPNVGVPPPPRTGSFGPGDHGAGGGQGPVSAAPYIAGSSPGTMDHAAAAYVPRGDEGVSTTEPLAPHHRPEGLVQPGMSVATDIDSAPPAPVAPMEPGTPPQLPAPGQPGLPPSGPPSPGPVVVPPGSPPPVGRVVPPTGRVAPQPPGRVGPGTSGPQRPYMPPPTNAGRSGQTSSTAPGRQAPMRPGPVSPGTSAPTNRDAGRTGPRGLGRPGPMGVPPGTAGPHAGGGRGTDSGSARASQRGGIVGGTPSRSGTGETPASSSRQRGTVIDGQGAAAARRPMGVTPPVNAVGSGGVSGANGRRSGSDRKKATGREGVVGEPRDDESGQPLDARVAMPGGAGLVMGAAQQSSKKERRQEERRPDKSTDGEQERPTGRRGSVPPVVE